ncbi:MAG: hypothetical protein EPO25_12265 [Gammaproteobacteria bacterium]|nr:MAG: hypothetical protein EPO25_12265 [Gammaproteobacteria bacterium]
MTALRVLAVSLCLLAGTAVADSGEQWLGRMGRALASTSYSGEFICESAGRSEKLRILHRVRDGRVSERLVSLSGHGRELVRQDDEVVVYLPDQKLAIIDKQPGRGQLLGVLPDLSGPSSPWYEVREAGREPALIGPAVVVVVRPADGYRFGYRIWIDEASGMPVRSELQDPAGRIIERLRFTSLTVGGEITDADLEPGFDRSRLRWVRQAPHGQPAVPAWRAAQVPPGFRLSVSGLQAMAGTRGPVNHLVFTDGLASVSVFIHAPAPGTAPVVGSGHAGVASTYSTVIQGHQVTAVGEVPPDTLRFIATGLKPAGSGRTP